jgi:purine-binding chemotaxis protein CheW
MAPGPESGGAASPARPSRLIVFRAGGERFAVPLEAVREVVVPKPPFARVPRAAAPVRGAMNLRGRVVAVVDLAPLLGLAPEALAPSQGHVVILDRHRRSLGLLVSAVLGVHDLPPGEGEAREPGALARGLTEVGGVPVTVLDADALEARAAALFQSQGSRDI